MPVRRLNYTARKRIAQTDIDIVLRQDKNGGSFFGAAIDLGSYKFPADARVFVEAYRQTTLMRFPFGTVSVPAPHSEQSLNDFETAEQILFRVKITASSGSVGVLLGEADQIRPRQPEEQPDQRLPLLPPVPDDIGEEVWRVDFEGGTYLKVSKYLPDWKQTVRSDSFRALVYPAAMRQILERILYRESTRTIEDLSDWRSRWLRFASKIPGSSPVPRSSDHDDDWIDTAVEAFAREFKLRSRFVAEVTE